MSQTMQTDAVNNLTNGVVISNSQTPVDVLLKTVAKVDENGHKNYTFVMLGMLTCMFFFIFPPLSICTFIAMFFITRITVTFRDSDSELVIKTSTIWGDRVKSLVAVPYADVFDFEINAFTTYDKYGAHNFGVVHAKRKNGTSEAITLQMEETVAKNYALMFKRILSERVNH